MLKNCFALPKLQYLLRACPAFSCQDALQDFDATVRSALTAIINVTFSEASYSQAVLPVSLGGLGVRRAQDLAKPAFIASLYSTRFLVDAVLSRVNGLAETGDLAVAREAWRLSSVGVVEPEEFKRIQQKAWDSEASGLALENLLQDADQVSRARLLAASQKESGLWLHAIPVPSLGTQLDPETLRIAVALRIGAKVCEPHKCRCGGQMDALGLHGLSCRYSAGRHPRHAALNDAVQRALQKVGLPSLLEPVGFDRRWKAP